MPKRIKKPLVKPEMRRQWLRRFEEDGESSPQIAKSDRYDVRTVRKQIEVARQEREAREARSMVLRTALEKHYADLVGFAQRLEGALATPWTIAFAERGDRMWSALREHLPRSPIWKGIDRWEHLRTELTRLQEEAVKRLLQESELNSPFKQVSSWDEVGLYVPALRDAINNRLRKSVERGPVPLGEFRASVRQDGLATVIYGDGGLCATVLPGQEAEVEEFIASLMKQVSDLPELGSMQHALSELQKVKEAVTEELATIQLRRVVPGRCRYCPI